METETEVSNMPVQVEEEHEQSVELDGEPEAATPLDATAANRQRRIETEIEILNVPVQLVELDGEAKAAIPLDATAEIRESRIETKTEVSNVPVQVEEGNEQSVEIDGEPEAAAPLDATAANRQSRIETKTEISNMPVQSEEEHEQSVEPEAAIPLDVPAAVTMTNGIPNDNDDDEAYEEGVSDYGSSYVSSSVLTSSLSSFEFSQSNIAMTTDQPAPIDQDEDSSNDDAMAQVVGPMMRSMNLGSQMSQALIERGSCIDSIKWLGHHLPESVVAFLIDEIEVEEEGRMPIPEYGAESARALVNGGYHGSVQSEESIERSDFNQSSDHTSSRSPRRNTNTYVIGYNESFHDSCSRLSHSSRFQQGYSSSESHSVLNENASMNGELHMQQARGMLNRPMRRHSVIGMQTTIDPPPQQHAEQLMMEVFANTRNASPTPTSPHRRMPRRSSMPLVVRSMGASTHGGRRTSWRNDSSGGYPFSDSDDGGSASAGNSIGFHKRTNSRKRSRRQRQRRGSICSTNSISNLLRETQEKFNSSTQSMLREDGETNYLDPFPEDASLEERLRQSRLVKTKASISLLSGGLYASDLHHEMDAIGHESDLGTGELYFADAIPPATRHDCALLFVDISGFTKLSTTLGVEPLSKTINTYFQMIVDEVEAFGGDILKFAGDAVFCEWQATTSNPLDGGDGISLAGSSQGSIEPWHGLGLEECVLTAAACGARIVDKCSDHPVYDGGGTSGTQVATLNVHCGVGFGEVVGVHVGDRETRMEYVILGDPIEQVADSILVASRGEVVASPEALCVLEETAVLDQCITEADMDKPQVIATKSTCFFHPKGTDHVQQDWTVTLQDFTTKPRERLAKRCDDWSLAALKRLRQRMSLYVHPVVVNDEFAMKIYPGDSKRAQERHRSEAELRDVYTVFIMPLITAKLTGDDEEDCKVLVLLNDIMLIMTRELYRFKGHLRQFIVDDKGVVLIANFGLRGSTFPNMVAERAIPYTTTVQTLLSQELNTQCQIGATFDTAYCGVVGGVSRHEYAVLGPSVNLAARLMGYPNNTGFLVDQSVKEKAGSRTFRALPPVKAKGYKQMVAIFEPVSAPDKIWKNLNGRFVGRERERSEIQCKANDIITKGGPAKFILISGEPGAGKSALCGQCTNEIWTKCKQNGKRVLAVRTKCSEGDAFVPFSLARPLFLEVLNYIHELENPDAPPRESKEVIDCEEIADVLYGGVDAADVSQSVIHLIQICEMADIPDHFIEILGKLILTRNRADVVDKPDNAAHNLMLKSIVHYLVKAFLQCTITFDLVIFALDDMTNMDEMSWNVIELLYQYSQNLFVIGTTRPVGEERVNVHKEFWNALHEDDKGNFQEIKLEPMEHAEVQKLIAKSLGRNENDIDPEMSQEVFMQSGGMPKLASEILEELFKDREQERGMHDSDRSSTAPGFDVDNIGELVLHRMDSLPSSVRTHLNLGAILGSGFELMDVVTVFEQYRGVTNDKRLAHAKSVHESLEEAVRKGILAVATRDSSVHMRVNSSDHPYAANNTIYKFTHDVWRSNILRLTLDEWKKDMHSLIAQSMETVMNAQLANDYRVLTRLFSHWKESGSAKKAAALALKMGRSLEDIGLTHQSLIVYRESLDMWKAMDNNSEEQDESIGGLSMQLLENLDSSDVEHLIKLNVALGRCYTNILDPKESIRAFQTALNFIHKAPSSVHLEDRSIIFPVFSGLFVALRFGHNEDYQYEEGLVRMFLRETMLYNDPVHYSRALAMRAEMSARRGDFESAIDIGNEMRSLYSVEDQSSFIVHAYGSDRSAQCISQCTVWYEHVGNHDEALKICDYILQDIVPKMDPQNVYNSFHLLYPVIWVMKEHGRALEAREIFLSWVVENFLTRLDERGLTSDRPLHTPILALLDMVGTDCKTERLDEYAEWALIENNGIFGPELNYMMGSAGRTADTITAEMCLLLSQRRNANEEAERIFFICKGYHIARDAVKLTCETDDFHGMMVAHAQAKPILEALRELYESIPPGERTNVFSDVRTRTSSSSSVAASWLHQGDESNTSDLNDFSAHAELSA